MLKNLDHVLTPELLYVLAAMGHGDDLVLCDANFPAASVAATTTHGSVIELAGADAARAARAILSLLPLDEHVATPAFRMAVTEDPGVAAPVQQLVQAELDRSAGGAVAMEPLERFEFYAVARTAFAVVRTSEREFYADFIFRKGAVRPEPLLVDGAAALVTGAP